MSVLHKWYSFCTNLSHNIFLTFSGPGLELTQMIFLSFWSKLENDKIMISAFTANGNALREVVELLGMSVWTSLCFWHAVFRTAWSSWTSGACLFELHSVSLYLYFSCMKYTPCSTWNSGCYHFWTSLWFERIILKHQKTYFLCILDI